MFYDKVQKWEAKVKKEGIKEGITEGIAEGKQIGVLEGKKVGSFEKGIEIAKNLLQEGMTIEFIHRNTKLPKKEIEALVKNK